jgi:hypothetical protein
LQPFFFVDFFEAFFSFKSLYLLNAVEELTALHDVARGVSI